MDLSVLPRLARRPPARPGCSPTRPTCPAAWRASPLFATRVSGLGSALYTRGSGPRALAARGLPCLLPLPDSSSYSVASPRAMRVAEAAARERVHAGAGSRHPPLPCLTVRMSREAIWGP
jgi:hypothetical protein